MIYSKVWIIIIILLFLVFSFITIREMPVSEEREDLGRYTQEGVVETGAINQVTAILFDYRGFDTLGEATVIFVTAIILGFFAPRKKTSMLGVSLSKLVHDGVALILPFILIFGFYIILFGHVSPGGGFTGGVILASAAIIFALTYSSGQERSHLLNPDTKKIVENFAMLSILGIGFIGIGLAGYFLANARTGIYLGQPGKIISAGWIPLLNLASGLKVGAGLAIIFVSLVKEE